MKTRTVYIASDDSVFATRKECASHERMMLPTVKLPRALVEEAIRQATPYMVSAKERRELAAKLTGWLEKA